MVKEAIVPSGSVPPNPVSKTVLLGAIVLLALLATGGWFAGTIAVVTWALAAVPLLLALLGSAVAAVLLAVLATVPLGGAGKLTVRVTALAAPFAKLAIAGNVTTPVAGL